MSLTLQTSELFNPLYIENLKIYQLVDAVLGGKDTIDKAGTTYLPTPSGRTEAEYAAYQTRAVLYNATAKTLDGLVGAIFRKETKVVLPDSLSHLLEDTDGEGNGIEQFSKRVTKDAIAFGRAGLLVDFPQAEGIKTLADERNANLKVRIQKYCPQSIVHWREVKVGGVLKLTHLLLRECGMTVGGHAFSQTPFTRYRLLELDNSGKYVVRLLDEREVTNDSGKKVKAFVETKTIYPVLPNGNRLDRIPFFFIGSLDNSATPNKSPLYDLAQLNLAHYRNSADYEEALFMIGQPTPWITGLSDDFIEANKSAIRIGSRECWLLPEGCQVGLLESKAEKNLLQKGMELKEVEMVGMGARLVQDNSSRGSESTESVLLRRSGEASQLSCISDNVSIAMTKALKVCAAWMGDNDNDVVFRLNKDFFGNRLSHQDITALVAAWQGSAITHDILLDNLRNGEVIDTLITNDEIKDSIKEEIPNLDFGGINDNFGSGNSTSD